MRTLASNLRLGLWMGALINKACMDPEQEVGAEQTPMPVDGVILQTTPQLLHHGTLHPSRKNDVGGWGSINTSNSASNDSGFSWGAPPS